MSFRRRKCAMDMDNNEELIVLDNDPEKPIVALAFKLEDGQYGQLTYLRVYQGTVAKDQLLSISATAKR